MSPTAIKSPITDESMYI